MKFFILLFSCLITFSMAAQNILSGTITDKRGEPLIGATVLITGTTSGTTTDPNGEFQLPANSGDTLIVSYVGFKTDTLIAKGNRLIIQLNDSDSELAAVTVESAATFIDNLSALHAEVITEKELTKAACCNLSESFETNASVDVSYTDAVSGTKMIRMLGLDGKYTLINREGIPHVRGLYSRSGLNFVPGTWIQSIDVAKGTGSVANGYESMTGQLSLEFKKPRVGEKLYLNGYVNSFGRMEINANARTQLNKKWSAAILTHANTFNRELDINDDGFMDLPKSRQVNLLNRYAYDGDRVAAQIGLHVLHDQKAGGQLGYDFSDPRSTTDVYGYSSRSTKAEVFGKLGILFPDRPYKGWGFIYSASIFDQESGFGANAYDGQQRTIYLNMINQNILGTTFHQYKLGASFLMDSYDESFADSTFTRDEIVPGAFIEYEYNPSDVFTVVLGTRIDFHNLYGIFASPRLHVRYRPLENTTLRATAGKGFRTANIIMENNQAFVSSRELIVREALDPEESWNVGSSLVQEVSVGKRKLQLTADYYYTNFLNQVVVDLDQNPGEINFYNLAGRSYASSFQIEAGYSLTEHLRTKVAYKLYDVKTTIDNELRQLPLISRERFFWNWSYSSKFDIWQADLTAQWFGKQRLPDTDEKPVEYQRPEFSPDFLTVNAQVSRAFRWGSIYLGSENLFDYRQDDPIIDAESPFGENFDGSLVWGPVPGRMVYLGFRYKID